MWHLVAKPAAFTKAVTLDNASKDVVLPWEAANVWRTVVE